MLVNFCNIRRVISVLFEASRALGTDVGREGAELGENRSPCPNALLPFVDSGSSLLLLADFLGAGAIENRLTRGNGKGVERERRGD